MKKSQHYTNDRKARERKIQEIGQGNVIKSFLVHTDKEYPRDWERQKVTDNGIIIIYNPYTEKMVTKLIARRKQIEDLYNAIGKKAPEEVLEKAWNHQLKGYHLI